jgi:hypothetical protein
MSRTLINEQLYIQEDRNMFINCKPHPFDSSPQRLVSDLT